jgi:hypothetical protein
LANDPEDIGEPSAQSGALRKPPAPVSEAALSPVSGKLPPTAHAARAERTATPETPDAGVNAIVDIAAKPSDLGRPNRENLDTQPSRATLLEEPPRHHDAAQPVRAVSLEFSPDGAGDVKLRVSERAGDVHITLHSADPSLSGRLHAGVNDLIGSLSHAGYEAEAWTAGQGQRQHREPEERRSRRPGWDVPGGEAFGGVMQQSES